ncbi:hypothetical protein Plhal304r1_c060g0145981 [Plasmopara halstedii]
MSILIGFSVAFCRCENETPFKAAFELQVYQHPKFSEVKIGQTTDSAANVCKDETKQCLQENVGVKCNMFD